MKAKFYGKEKTKVVKFNYWELKDRLGHFTDRYYLSVESVERLIEVLKKYRDSDDYTYSDSFICEIEYLFKYPIFIAEKELSYTPNVGETVQVEGKKIKITDKKYDTDNDVIHYYSDYVTGINISQYEKSKKRCTNEMIELLEQELPRMKQYEELSNNRSKFKEKEEELTFIKKIIKWFKG